MRRDALRIVVVVAAVVLAAGCGTRVERTAAPAVGGGASLSDQAAVRAADPSQGGAAGSEDASGTAPPESAADGGAGPSTPGEAAAPRTGSAGSPAGTGSGEEDQPANSAPGAAPRPRPSDGEASTGAARPGASGAPRPAAPSPAGPPAAAVPSGGSPALIASVGTYSGPAAASLKPMLDGAQLWVRYINSRGGLNGHLVKFSVYDDGADPARHRAQVQEAVEQRKVIAFLANAEALTGEGTKDYIASHRVPVIGIDGGWDFPYENPMYFPQHPSGNSMYLGFVLSTAQQLTRLRKTKLGVLSCQEAQGCINIDKMFEARARDVGLDLVYQGKASIAQPDFTAECLSARNAGAESLFVVMDGNSVTRVASSCARQGYRPQYGLPATVILDRFKDDPNLDGTIGSSDVMPWFLTGNPAADEFHRAVSSFGRGLVPGVGMVLGWAAGKLLERAGRSLAEPPTNEAILRELWTVKQDTLNGLTYPLTFTEGQPPPRVTCWFNVALQKGRWVLPDGLHQFCGS